MKLFIAICMLFSSPSFSFVLLSGPEEAKLPISYEQPVLTFHWDESAPPIEEKEELNSGLWTNYTNSDYMEQMILLAMKTWNDVPGSYARLALVRDPSIAASTEDQVFAIATKKQSSSSSSAAALPIIEESQITDCDINIGTNSIPAKILVFTIAHELGHCLGLGHAHTNYDAIMGYSRTDRTLELGADDMAGVIYLYPSPEYGATPPLPIKCGSIAGLNKKDDWPWLLFMILFPCFLPFLKILPRREFGKHEQSMGQ